MRAVLRRPLTVLLGLATCACVSVDGSRYPYYLLQGQKGAPQARRWLLAPTNALSPAPTFLVAPGERLQTEIGTYLEEAGRTYSSLPQSKALAAVRALGPGAGPTSDGSAPDERLSALARALAGTYEFEVMAFPELVIHPVLVQQGRSGTWNGVKRPVRVIRGEDAPEGMFSMTGRQPGISLRMRIFARDGTKYFESYGGLELLQEARTKGNKFYMEIRPDLLTDPGVLREGVELALWPYLPRPD